MNSDKNVTPRTHVIDITVVPGALGVVAGNGLGLGVAVEAAPGGAKPAEGHASANGGAPEAVARDPEPAEA